MCGMCMCVEFNAQCTVGDFVATCTITKIQNQTQTQTPTTTRPRTLLRGRATWSNSSSTSTTTTTLLAAAVAVFVLVVFIGNVIILGREKQNHNHHTIQHTSSTIPSSSFSQHHDQSPPPPTSNNEPTIHVVFSTGCNQFQHWQAELLLHSHFRVGQPGKISRVVSGCDTEKVRRQHGNFLTHPEGLADEPTPLEELRKSSSPHLLLHVTPSFEGAREFPWINKPMGLAHWIQHSSHVDNNSIIVIIDPDMFFMDRLVLGKRKLSGTRANLFGDEGLLCSTGCRRGAVGGSGSATFRGMDAIGITDLVRPGQPVAQTYGLGGGFVHRYDIKGIAGVDSPASRLNSQDAAQYYSVGPPMMLHVEDFRRLAPLWAKFMRPVYAAVPGDIQADMYAYSIAAAHLELPHLMLDNYMVSSPRAGGEGWPLTRLDDATVSHPCSDPNRYLPKQQIPTFLHVAHRYDAHSANFMFHKGHVPPNILSCELPLVMEPPDHLIDDVNPVTDLTQKHNNYLLCLSLQFLNPAVLAWKKKFCPANHFNIEKRIRLQKRGQHCAKTILGKSCWDFATWDELLLEQGHRVRTASPVGG